MIGFSMILSLLCGVVFIQGYAIPGANTNANTNINTNVNSLRRNKSGTGSPYVSNERARRMPRDWLPIMEGHHVDPKKFPEQVDGAYFENYPQMIRMIAMRAANIALSITRSRAEELAETVAESVAAAVGDAVAHILDIGHYDHPIIGRRTNTNYNTNLNTNIVGRTSSKNDIARDSNGEEITEDERVSNVDMADFEEQLESLLGAGRDSGKADYAYVQPDFGQLQFYPGGADAYDAYGTNLRGIDRERRTDEEFQGTINPSLLHIISPPNPMEHEEAPDFIQAMENAEAKDRQRNVNVNTNINEIANRMKQNSRYRRL